MAPRSPRAASSLLHHDPLKVAPQLWPFPVPQPTRLESVGPAHPPDLQGPSTPPDTRRLHIPSSRAQSSPPASVCHSGLRQPPHGTHSTASLLGLPPALSPPTSPSPTLRSPHGPSGLPLNPHHPAHFLAALIRALQCPPHHTPLFLQPAPPPPPAAL